MQVEIKIDSSYAEPKVIILTDLMTDEVNSIVKMLSDNSQQIIFGYKNGKICVLEQDDLCRIYSSSGKVFAETDTDKYLLRSRLYEAEERLNRHQFVRISNSEIINLKKVKSFDLSFTGTIFVELKNGAATYVSRRCVSKVKEILGAK